MKLPYLSYGTPRRLPKAKDLPGRVVVLDIAFSANVGGASFEKVTKPFLDGLGDRLAMWVDHHDHEMHEAFADDPRFVLATKAQHPACPEMVIPSLVERAGPIDTICAHGDFDGLCAAAKWIRGGEEPYPGADEDARAIDTRMGIPSDRADIIDRALRGNARDDELKGTIVRYLAGGAHDDKTFARLQTAARTVDAMEAEAHRLVARYQIEEGIAVCDATRRKGPYDKTILLLEGQKLAPISVVHDETTVTVAAPFDSGVDLVKLLGLSGGMPTRVSVAKKQLDEVLEKLRTIGRAEGPR